MGAFQSTGYTSDDIERIKEEVRVQMRAAPCPECARLTKERDNWRQQCIEADASVARVVEMCERAEKERDAALAERDEARKALEEMTKARDSAWSSFVKARNEAIPLEEERDALRLLLMKARRWIVAGHPFHDIAAAKGCDVCMAVAEIDAALGSPR